MKTEEKKPAAGGSWRSIRQEVNPHAMSRRGRRRQLLAWTKAGGAGVVLAAVTWGAYEVVHSWRTDRASLAKAVHAEPVREIVLITDGVLSQKWAAGVLALPPSTSLMALDLPALRDRLLASGQVRVAVLTRNFPDTLVVTLQERTPVARVQADDGHGAPRQLLVAKDGIVYEGANYDRALLAGLPWLKGVRLVRAAGGFAPIPGMTEVSALLSTAQLQAPHLYRDWLVVSLERLAAADEIVVTTSDALEIVFSRKRDFFKQVAQLDYVIDTARTRPEVALQSVNLSYEGQVPVRVRSAPEPAAAGPGFSFPTPQRKGARDL
jgi:cell division protein FtsQ